MQCMLCVVEGIFEAPYSVVAVAAYEALAQFDSENHSVNLRQVNFVNIVAEVTSTFLSTFRDEFDRQHNTKLLSSSTDHPMQHLGRKFVRPESSGVQTVVAAAKVPHASTEENVENAVSGAASTEEKPIRVRVIVFLLCLFNPREHEMT